MSQIPDPQWPQEIPVARGLALAAELDASAEGRRLRLEEKRKRLLEAGALLLPGLEPAEPVLPMRLQEDGFCDGGDDDDGDDDDDGGDDDGGDDGDGGGDDGGGDWWESREGISVAGDSRMFA